jgi:TPR repeat protein
VEKDEKEAVRWFQKAAEQDYPAALHRMGNCYLQGVGVDRDVVQAMRYYRRAADLKYPPAIEVLHKLEGGSGG